MLKNETIQELEDVFQDKNIQHDEYIPGGAGVEVVNLDLIRVHINARGSDAYINAVVDILKNNKEPGPLKLHQEAAKSFNYLYYIDIIQI